MRSRGPLHSDRGCRGRASDSASCSFGRVSSSGHAPSPFLFVRVICRRLRGSSRDEPRGWPFRSFLAKREPILFSAECRWLGSDRHEVPHRFRFAVLNSVQPLCKARVRASILFRRGKVDRLRYMLPSWIPCTGNQAIGKRRGEERAIGSRVDASRRRVCADRCSLSTGRFLPHQTRRHEASPLAVRKVSCPSIQEIHPLHKNTPCV